MNGKTYAPGAARPDLAAVVMRHAWASLPMSEHDRPHLWATGTHYAATMMSRTSPENFYAIGTDLRAEQHPVQLDASADDADRILRNHRRMAHRAWVREIEAEHARGSEASAYRAWMAARLACGLPT